jgi:hypothetical protein
MHSEQQPVGHATAASGDEPEELDVSISGPPLSPKAVVRADIGATAQKCQEETHALRKNGERFRRHQ